MDKVAEKHRPKFNSVRDPCLRLACARAEKFVDNSSISGAYEDIVDEFRGLLKLKWSNIYSLSYEVLAELVQSIGVKSVLEVEVVPTISADGYDYLPVSVVATIATPAYLEDHRLAAGAAGKGYPSTVVDVGFDTTGIKKEHGEVVVRILNAIKSGTISGAREAFLMENVTYNQEASTLIIENPPICSMTFLNAFRAKFSGLVKGITFQRVTNEGKVSVLMGIQLDFDGELVNEKPPDTKEAGYMQRVRPSDGRRARQVAASPY